MWTRRLERVNELLLQEISRVVTERQDPDVGFVTFTGVKTTEDLMQARVFYSVLGDDAAREATAAALQRLKHEIHRDMRRLESLKRIPALTFVYDGTPERAARVHELIEKIHQEEGVPPSAEGTPSPQRSENRARAGGTKLRPQKVPASRFDGPKTRRSQPRKAR